MISFRELSYFSRLEIHTIDTTSANLYLSRVPLSLAALQQKCELWETDIAGDKIPCTTCKVGAGEDAKKGGLVGSIMIQEPANLNIGMGVLPVITQVFIKL